MTPPHGALPREQLVAADPVRAIFQAFASFGQGSSPALIASKASATARVVPKAHVC